MFGNRGRSGKTRADPALLLLLQQRAFIQSGVEILKGPNCPLCDTEWQTEQHLRDYLEAKLAKSEAARKLQQDLLENGAAVARAAIHVIGLVTQVKRIADLQGDEFGNRLSVWIGNLEAFKTKLLSVETIRLLRDR